MSFRPRLVGGLERLIFEHRPLVLLFALLLSLPLFYQASQLRPQGSLEKMIPLEHPYIRNLLAYRGDLANLGNSLRIVVAVQEGDIFDRGYLESLRQIHDELFYLPGTDRAGLKSLWSPGVRWTEVTEEGFAGGEVIPPDYDGSRESLERVRRNVLRSGLVGRLVANDFRSSIIEVPLLERYPDPDDPGRMLQLDYWDLSHQLEEKVRERYQAHNPNLRIHIVGFAKRIGDLIDGLIGVALFFALAVAITLFLLLLFTRCLKCSLLVVFTTLVAVLWQLGLLRLLGYGLDPYSMLVPFLIFAIGISHGVQKVNVILAAAGELPDALSAARRAFRQLFVPGLTSLLSDAAGFLTLLLIDIGVIRELAISASLGVAVIILGNLILLPVCISYSGVSARASARVRRAAQREHPGWRLLARCARPKVAGLSLAIAGFLLLGGLWYGQNREIGDLDPGAPELHPDSRYNRDNAYVIRHYSTSSDILVVLVRTPPESCSSHAALEAMDDLMWRLENTVGVQSTLSMVTVAKQVITGMNEGSLKWQSLSRNQDVLNNSIARAEGLYNGNCSLAPLLAFLEDHRAATLERVVGMVEGFAAEHNREDLQFLLGAGNAVVEAATNQVIAAWETPVLVAVYGAVSLMCLLAFRSLAATCCVILPLTLASVLGNALLAALGIGVKVATLPVLALGVGIGVDYGIYIYSRLEGFLRQGLPLQQAYYQALRSTGRAVLFTGVCLAVSVATWIFSAIKFQADMGLLLTFMFLWNMLGAIWLLPALACFLLGRKRLRQASGGSG